MTPLEQLGREISSAHDEELEQRGYLGEVRGRLLAPTKGTSRRRFALPALAAAAVALLIASALYWWTSRPLTFDIDGATAQPGQWLAAGDDEALLVRFSDGSNVELRSGATGRVEGLTADGARLFLERGEAQVDVHHRSGARWTVDVGPFELTVIGTRFDVGWDPTSETFSLTMHEGRVRVSGPTVRERVVDAGEVLTVWVDEARVELARPADAQQPGQENPLPEDDLSSPDSNEAGERIPTPTGSSSDGGVAPPDSAHEPTGGEVTVVLRDGAPANSREGVPSWRELVRQGRYGDAMDQVDSHGWETVLERATTADLLLLADSARLAGRLTRSAELYRRLRQHHPGTEAAATAAFSLGRLDFDHLGAPSSAGRWFNTYLTERPGGRFAREAQGRLIEARRDAGDADGARQAAQSYLSRYPSGPHARLARSVMGNQ